MLVDTHCHLNFHAFDGDRIEVLQRAGEAGVTRLVIPATDVASGDEALALAAAHEQVYAAVGVHPSEAATWTEATPGELRRQADQPRVVAIGEIGLDYYRDYAPQDLQRQVFEAQLRLAAELDRPVIVHSRDASSEDRRCTHDVLALLEQFLPGLPAGRPGVLHSYGGDEPSAFRAVELGFCIGFTGPVTFKNAPMLHALAAALPLENILIETDAPFLTPHPHRGQRNEPAYVRHVAEKIASLRGVPLDIIAKATTSNAQRLFHW